MKSHSLIALVRNGACICTGLCFSLSAQAQPFSYNFEELVAGSEIAPLTGNLNESTGKGRQGNAYGWYGNHFATKQRVTVSNKMNSPWDQGGRQSAVLVGDSDSSSAPSLYNYFTNRTGLTNYNPNKVEVTGSLGKSLTGSGYQVSWDFYAIADSLNTQPYFGLYSKEGDIEAITLDIRYQSHQLRYYDSAEAKLVDHKFKEATWYRFEIVDINLTRQTYGFRVYEWGRDAPVVTLSELSFKNKVTEIDYFRNRVNTENTNPVYYLDNFSIK
ncbi:hypothetical protein QEH59_00845 [Coraliomargarita sp. SDUM461004]|uniref:Uncharacterized protein n=1 Tax=Thalassobacterium sedimentorum TaxID=3041258 RepID=A0ABU1AEA8_9BACT|nr:hypothetical protein [Coraliomargarita sp. SDUM461004]MDQ8192952.1 hypothetical protein [Coraliomargarita sp. SDUM461004]